MGCNHASGGSNASAVVHTGLTCALCANSGPMRLSSLVTQRHVKSLQRPPSSFGICVARSDMLHADHVREGARYSQQGVHPGLRGAGQGAGATRGQVCMHACVICMATDRRPVMGSAADRRGTTRHRA